MDSTLTIAKTIGVYFILSGLFVIFNRKTLTLILKDLFDHRAITYVIGVFIAIAGTALILSNKVTDPISNFIEIISWMILIKGILYIFFPDVIKGMMKGFTKFTYFLAGVAVLAVGIYLVFFL
jgi:hypothetical protein